MVNLYLGDAWPSAIYDEGLSIGTPVGVPCLWLRRG
jgi:hypothetical protein